MSAGPERLAPQERRALLAAPLYRIVGTPVIAALSLLNTAIIVRETGAAVFGLVSLVTTVTLIFPFADLGIGATVLNASAQLHGPARDVNAADVVRRGYRVLFGVAAVVAALALVVMALDGWVALVGFSSGPQDRWAITVAAILFALTIPAGLGVRILIGIDRNPLATLVLMSCPALALVLTLLLYAGGVAGIWYAVSGLGGLLGGLLIGNVLALRLSGLGWSAFAPVSAAGRRSRLLTGSLWLFLVGVGLPVGLQTGRVILAHLSTPEQLAEYALLAQVWAICWSVLSTAGLAYWPIFVKRRSAVPETIRMWWQLTAAFGVLAALAALGIVILGPWACGILSGGRITVSTWLAIGFGALLIGQAMHLPAAVLLTRPNEARWQAIWTMAMAVLSISLACAVAAQHGAAGVVAASALAILLAQVAPDLAWVPRLVRRRPTDGLAAEPPAGQPR